MPNSKFNLEELRSLNRDPELLAWREFIRSAIEQDLAEAVAQTGDVSWFIAPLGGDGCWAAWTDADLWPHVEVYASRAEALASHADALESLAQDAEDSALLAEEREKGAGEWKKREAEVLRTLAAKVRSL